MYKYIVKYQEKKDMKWRTTSLTSPDEKTDDEIIDHFGLGDPDIESFTIEEQKV